MVDLKYGFYRLFWWTGFMISISFVAYLARANWVVSTVLVLAVAFAFISILRIFERRHPYFHEKNRQSTIKHFMLFRTILIFIIFILLNLFFRDVTYNTIFPIYFFVFADIIPSFFTELV